MKKTVALVLIALFLLGGISWAASAKEASRLNQAKIKEIIGDKFVAMDLISLSADQSKLFLLARDSKTRNLEWFLIDPFTSKLLRKGECPFKAFTQSAVSTDNTSAIVFAQYPVAMWHLDVEKGKWKKIYDNPKKGGLAFLSISPINFAESYRAYTIMDDKDKDNVIKDTYITSIMFDPVLIKPFISLKEMRDLGTKAVSKKPQRGWIFSTDLLRYAESQNMVYVLQSMNKRTKEVVNYLLKVGLDKKPSLLYKTEGKIIPLDYSVSKKEVLIGISGEQGKNVVKLVKDGKVSTIMKGNAVTGRIFDNGGIGLAVVEGNSLGLYAGKKGKTPSLLFRVTKPYSIAFSADGRKLVLMNNQEIVSYRISK